MARRKDLMLTGTSLIVVLAAVYLGFHMLGSPAKQRAISADLRRVQDLRLLAMQIRPEGRGGELPAAITPARNSRDPVTNAPYEYRKGEGSRYQLCATFSFASEDEGAPFPAQSGFWNHSAGYFCYHLDAAQLTVR